MLTNVPPVAAAVSVTYISLAGYSNLWLFFGGRGNGHSQKSGDHKLIEIFRLYIYFFKSASFTSIFSIAESPTLDVLDEASVIIFFVNLFFFMELGNVCE